MNINKRVGGSTILLGLLGNPVAHSISPQLHNTISDMLGIDAIYTAFKVSADKLGTAVDGLRACNFLGFNITVPYKEAVISLCDELDEYVSLIGAANTVKNVNGKLIAYNTDGTGFINALILQTGKNVRNKKTVVLGAGGTARSISIKLAQEGAESICIINRTIEKARFIEDIVNKKIRNIACSMEYEEAYREQVIERSDIIINTTSLGLEPQIEGCPLKDSFKFSSNQLVYDVIYKPAKTKLMKNAERHGCTTVNGLGMLICQGIEAYEIWMERKIPIDMIEKLFIAFTTFCAV